MRRLSAGGLATFFLFAGPDQLWSQESPPPPDPRPPRLAASWNGHDGAVHALAVSPDGKRVVSAGDDGTVRLWNAADGESLAVLKGHRDKVWAAAFLPSGRIVSGGWDGLLKVWDGAVGKETASFGTGATANGITTLAVTPDGARVATGGFDAVVRLWDVGQQKELRAWKGHGDTVWAVAFAPDGRRVFSGSFDGSVRVWDVDADAALATWTEDDPGQRGWKRALVLAPDGRTALLGGASSPREWDVARGRQLAPFDGAHAESVLALALAPDGQRLVTGGFDGALQLWDRAKRQSLARWHAGQGEAVWALAFLRDGRLLSAGASGAIHLWELPR